ncbi:MAG: hypothetical protein JJLCMIEE_01644 [Acidimicrobiales bacterium]|nr:hypothetical protein [Acidimicrobiales bacterium]
MNAALADAIAEMLAVEVLECRPTVGGDICTAYRLTLGDGRRIFAKTRHDAPEGMFRSEAEGLAWLARAGAARVPAPVAVCDGDAALRFLALEWIEPGRPNRAYDTQLGRDLAALHSAGSDRFGFASDGFIGSIPQDNTPGEDWAEFYWTRRLEPLLRETCDTGLLDEAARRGFSRLADRLPELVGPDEAPARLHGDLWSGNAICDSAGSPWLIDPAAYGGHREMDLAMMRLFGGFGSECFAAYHEAHPLADGHEDRVALYQLYPLLVHVLLFGSGYVGRTREALRSYVSA